MGEATGLAMVVLLRPVAGLHEYVTPPVAVSCTEEPEQMAALFGMMFTLGSGFTVTTTWAVTEQPLAEAVTV